MKAGDCRGSRLITTSTLILLYQTGILLSLATRVGLGRRGLMVMEGIFLLFKLIKQGLGPLREKLNWLHKGNTLEVHLPF